MARSNHDEFILSEDKTRRDALSWRILSDFCQKEQPVLKTRGIWPRLEGQNL